MTPKTTAHAVGIIRARRKELKMSAQRLADMFHDSVPMERGTIASLECGRRENITIAELMEFSRILELHPMAFLDCIMCDACFNRPPAGFSCNVCGAGQVPGVLVTPEGKRKLDEAVDSMLADLKTKGY